MRLEKILYTGEAVWDFTFVMIQEQNTLRRHSHNMRKLGSTVWNVFAPVRICMIKPISGRIGLIHQSKSRNAECKKPSSKIVSLFDSYLHLIDIIRPVWVESPLQCIFLTPP